jgi:ABC-type multidrug transport system ATPase subunit/pSer/pThr/pTyr-binding forkhead associated (FHA) protein
MNIILANPQSADGRPEREFTKPVVLIGRDAGECDIAFDKAQYPMVSRKHAELCISNGQWVISDLGSSYGTFMNGQKIVQPTPISAGSSLQFGMDGPKLVVVWYEVGAASAQPAYAPAPPQAKASVQAPPMPSAPPVQLPAAQLDITGPPQKPSLKIAKTSIWFGREADCDVVFDSSSGTVSRRHAEIAFDGSDFVIKDNKSFNGTLINGQRISTSTPLYHNDQIQLGLGGPVIVFNAPSRMPPVGSSLPGQRSVPIVKNVSIPAGAVEAQKTMVANLGRTPSKPLVQNTNDPQLLMTVQFGDKSSLSIGRDETNDIRIDGLQISKHHAKLRFSGGEVLIEDSNSTNGVFVNGARVSRQVLRPNDSVQIGAFVIRVDQSGSVGVYDARSKMRIDVVNVGREIKGRAGVRIQVLDNVSFAIQPNEFVGLLGPSGAGKSSLIEAMNGVTPAKAGNVFINDLDLNRHFDSLKQAIGYVPQEDIIHRELSVYRTLYYVARLRLSRDVSKREIDQIVNEVLDVTGLAERRNVAINKLSGGQRKRVSIAVELITKPSCIFLDEPTSGLDPATEDRIMRLFRQVAESGRTVVMTTHAMENVKMFDKIAILMRGRLVFFGKPDEALTHLKAANFRELYERLEEPVNEGVKEHGEANRPNLEDHAADEWQRKFLATLQYKQYVEEPLKQSGQRQAGRAGKRRRLGIFGSIRQWATLSRRYFEVLRKDRLNLFIMLAQPPLIALLTFIVMGTFWPRDFLYFVIALVAVWFGTSDSAREIVRERAVYKRERMFNLGIIPYLFSKLFVLGLIVFFQCIMLYVPLKLMHFIGIMPMPGELGGIPQLWAMLLTGFVGIATGLFVSSLFKSRQLATTLVPLILIPQILFSGIGGVPQGLNKVVSMTMPAAWSFDTMKRFSTLDTLEPEGARSSTKGLGLYKYVESENEKALNKAKKDLDNFKNISGNNYQESQTGEPSMADELVVPDMKKVPQDLSGYVTFLHPWMNEVVSQFVLMLMFWIMAFCTLIALKLKDIR